MDLVKVNQSKFEGKRIGDKHTTWYLVMHHMPNCPFRSSEVDKFVVDFPRREISIELLIAILFFVARVQR